MTSTDDGDLLSSDQPLCTSLPALRPSDPPSRTYSITSDRLRDPSSGVCLRPISATSPSPSLLSANPQWISDKFEHEKRKDADTFQKERETKNEKMEETVERLRLEKEEIIKDRDKKIRAVRALRRNIQELEKYLHELEEERDRDLQVLSEAEKSRDQAVSQLNKVERMYEDMEKLKNGSDAALAEVRQFVTTSDPADGNFLLQKLTDFNALIDDFAFNLSTELADPSQSLQVDQLLHVVQFLPHQLVPMAYQSLELPDPRTPTCDDITIGYTRAILHSTITLDIWARFCWSLLPDEDRLLSTVYRHLRDVEPQALHARWRSLTYQTVLRSIVGNPAPEKAAHYYEVLLRPFYDNIGLLNGKGMSPQDIPTYLAELEKIVTSALELHKLIRQDYLSVNYDVLAPLPSSVFDPEMMERVEAPQSSSRPNLDPELVVACVGVGLVRMAQEDDGKGQKVSQILAVKKAEVLTTRWLERKDEAEGKMVCER